MATSKTAAAPELPKEPKDKVTESSTQKTVATKATAESTAPENDFLGLLEYVFKLYKESWEAFKLNFVTFIILALIPFILLLVSIPFILLPFFADGGAAAIFVTIVTLLLLFIIGAIFLPAITVTELESVRGNKIDLNEVFEKSKSLFLPYLGVLILSGLAVLFGLIFFVIPGLLAIFFLALSTYILVDKKVGVIDAMKGSYELTKANWQWVAALFIVNMAISFVGYIPYIGWAASLALSVVYLCLPAIVYLKIKK